MRAWFWCGVGAVLSLSAGCVVVDDDDPDKDNGEAGDSSTGGRDSSGGTEGETTGGRETAGGTGGENTGGRAPTGGREGDGGAGNAGGEANDNTGGTPDDNAGGEAGGGSEPTGPVDCTDAETLPERIEEDLEIGPGCVRVDRTIVIAQAKLTIAPGTTLKFAPAGYLDLELAALSALGTEQAPIVFTSESDSPLPGDWQCVYLDRQSTDVEIRHGVFEYGGDGCDANGARNEGLLIIDGAARAVTNSVFRHSLTNGVSLLREGNVRTFENNRFEQNQVAPLRVAAPQILALGTGLDFQGSEPILVDTTYDIDKTGTWRAQSVPFHVVGKLNIGGDAEVTIEAGTRIELDGNSVEVYNANLISAGTAEAPVVFTSAFASPGPGDWGCVTIGSTTGTPRFDHTIFEYAGNGQGCTGNAEGALNVPSSAIIRDSTFRQIDGFAIQSRDCDPDWCENQFEEVKTGPLSCDSPSVASACPLEVE
ncbi:MAG: hypothetical protein M3020_08320 [Myxococcota bacterium]|nr:hypothetical protein [Myxococcota bacterium]